MKRRAPVTRPMPYLKGITTPLVTIPERIIRKVPLTFTNLRKRIISR